MTDIIEALHSIAHSYSMKSKWEELYHETIEAYSLLKQNALHDAGEKIEEYTEKYEKNSDIKAPQFIDALKTSPQGLPNAFSGIGTKIGAVWSLIIMANVVTFPLLLILIKVPVIGKLVFVLFGITLVALAAAIIFFPFTNALIFNPTMNVIKEKKKVSEWKEAFDKTLTDVCINSFLADYKKFDTAFLQYVEDYKANVIKIRLEYKNAKEALTEEYAEKINQCTEEIDKFTAELSKATVISPDLFRLAGAMASYLEIGRADSLKEAINLALEEERRDNQEAERRAEAAREAEEAAAHNRAMEAAAKAQAAAAQVQAEIAQKQADQARIDALAEKRRNEDALRRQNRTCHWCKNYHHCPNSGQVTNCGAFVPKN